MASWRGVPENPTNMNLPEDWWRYMPICQGLADWFSRHLLGLFIEIEIEGKLNRGVYTGFLLDHLENLWWVTAGHVIEEICGICSDPKVGVRRMRWLDGCQIPGAESIPVNERDLHSFSALDRGLDLGMMLIPMLDAVSIVRNERVLIITEQAWKNIHLAQPEGYYLLGYPQEWVAVKETSRSGNRSMFSLHAGLACLPVRQVQYPGLHPTKEFWNDPGAFYGEILPFADMPDHQPGDIRGMSGGPLLSIERTPDKQMLYRLFGIQRSWDRDGRLIRAEPIQRLIELIT